jgi:hypothetical protein
VNAISDFEKQHLIWLNNASSNSNTISNNSTSSTSDSNKVKEEETSTLTSHDKDYLYIRNRIILLSQQVNPSTSATSAPYLSVTQCRKVIGKDSNIILSIHQFLDTYDVINRQILVTNKKFYYGYPLPSATATSTSNGVDSGADGAMTIETKQNMSNTLDEYLNTRLDALYKKVRHFI